MLMRVIEHMSEGNEPPLYDMPVLYSVSVMRQSICADRQISENCVMHKVTLSVLCVKEGWRCSAARLIMTSLTCPILL